MNSLLWNVIVNANRVNKTKEPLGSKNKWIKNVRKAPFYNAQCGLKKQCLSMMNQVGIERSSTETRLSTHFDNYQNQNNPNLNLSKSSLLSSQSKNKIKNVKLDCKDVLLTSFWDDQEEV